MNVFHLRFSLVASVKVSRELLMQTCWWPLSDHWSVQTTSPHLSGFVFYGCLESLTELSALWNATIDMLERCQQKLEIVDWWSTSISPTRPQMQAIYDFHTASDFKGCLSKSICKKNPSRTVCAVEWAWQDVSYSSSFIAKSCLNDLKVTG